jgi:hypothetical protein
MSNAPGSRQLTRAVKNLAAGQFALNHPRVIFLSSQGEILDGGPPPPVDQIFARRKSYLDSEQLGAVAYLGRLGTSDLVLTVLEIWESPTKRVTHTLLATLQSGAWLQVPDDFGDQWAKNFGGGEAKGEPMKE